MPMPAGRRTHLVTWQAPTHTTTSDSGFSATWANLTPSQTWVAIEPATSQRLERIAAGTVISHATHIVTTPYIANLTTKCRALFGARILNVVGVANVDERNGELIVVCVEKTE